jgi:hypothetical protein
MFTKQAKNELNCADCIKSMQITNGDYLNQLVHELVQYNDLPIVLSISNRPIVIDWSDVDDNVTGGYLVKCVDMNTKELIALKGCDVLAYEYDKEWLNDKYRR